MLYFRWKIIVIIVKFHSFVKKIFYDKFYSDLYNTTYIWGDRAVHYLDLIIPHCKHK